MPFIVTALGRDVDTFTLHIYAALAEQKRKMISQRTNAGLQAAKAKGKKLGNPMLKAKPGTRLSENNRALASARDETLRSTLAPMVGMPSRAIAQRARTDRDRLPDGSVLELPAHHPAGRRYLLSRPRIVLAVPPTSFSRDISIRLPARPPRL